MTRAGPGDAALPARQVRENHLPPTWECPFAAGQMPQEDPSEGGAALGVDDVYRPSRNGCGVLPATPRSLIPNGQGARRHRHQRRTSQRAGLAGTRLPPGLLPPSRHAASTPRGWPPGRGGPVGTVGVGTPQFFPPGAAGRGRLSPAHWKGLPAAAAPPPPAPLPRAHPEPSRPWCADPAPGASVVAATGQAFRHGPFRLGPGDFRATQWGRGGQ